MKNINLSKYKLLQSDGVYTLKNLNTTIGFVRFNEKGEIEYIFVKNAKARLSGPPDTATIKLLFI